MDIKRRKRYQPYRRLVQGIVLFFIVTIPLLNILEFDFIQGTLCSIGFREIKISCSLGALQTFLANREVHLPLLLSASFFIVLALLAGRVFCSWLCVQHVASEAGDKLRDVAGKNEPVRPDSSSQYKKGRKVMLSILGTGLVATFVTGVPVICYICPVGMICRLFITGTFLHKLGGEFIIILAILAAEFTVARRGWCKYLCPVGALYSLLPISLSMRVKRNHTLCAECGTCENVCPMGDSPLQGKIGRTCTNCAICIDSCPEGALRLTLLEKKS